MSEFGYAPARRKTIDEHFHDIVQSGVIWVWLMFWAMEAFMNARFGWRLVGGGLIGLPMGALLFGVAVLGAYLPMRYRDVPKTDPHRKRRRFVFGVLIAMCFAVCQASGWANLGIMLADGATARDTRATERSTAKEDLERARETRRQIGVVRALAAIEADLDLELRRTSKQYPHGNGPKATALRGELETAREAARLDEIIPKMVAALGEVEQVAEGRPELDVLMRIFVGAGEKEISFWIPPVLTALIGIIATFGPIMIGLQISSAAREPAGPSGYLPPADIFDAYRGGDAYHPHQVRPPYGGAYRHEIPRGEYPDHQTAGRPVSHAQPQQPPAPVQGAPAAASNAPITINVGGATSNGAADHAPGAGVAGRRLVRRPAAEGMPGLPSPPAGHDAGRHLPVTPAAAWRPVDRSQLNTIIDQLITFHAAELIREEGALVPFPDLVERYRIWAQGRAIDPAAFAIMFPMATGVQIIDVAGVQHFVGARLRHQLKVVGGA